ncbi:redoxin domain-containing protein [Micromonospora sp. HK10]|uniref:redoxin domain-containing protein n=1 Tax=Micromonospora sp. HK10 TaxID=1538294 RepID=UPI000626F51E|nr:redoxin domain-containing protein [Micromonospora sp. HK10]KKK07374.1 redoxin [Micromonospora sp. HK10]
MPAVRSAQLPLTLTVTLALALAGCADSGGTNDAAPTSGGPAAAAPTGLAGTSGATGTNGATGATGPTATGPAGSTGNATPVPATLDFTARTVDGGSFAGRELAGRPAVLWFWAAWCSRCRGVADDVAAVRRDHADRVNLVGVAGLGSGADAMRRFARDTGITAFPNLADDEGTLWRRFGVTSQEWYVLLDSTGTVVHSGALSQAELRRRVAELA